MKAERLRELFAWIESFTNLERSGAVFSARAYQLERMRHLAHRLGDPQDAFRGMHVAGSKGKGSTAALLAWSWQAWRDKGCWWPRATATSSSPRPSGKARRNSWGRSSPPGNTW